MNLKFKICNLKLGIFSLCAEGFTLLEVLITTAILAVMAVITIPYFHGFTERQTMNQAVKQVKNDLHTVQNRALSSTDRDSVNDANYGWWGIDFEADSNNYTIKLIQSDSPTDPVSNQSGIDSGTREKSLPEGIRTASGVNQNIWFKMVTGDVYVGSSALSGSTPISITDGSSTEEITVYEGGRIE